MIRKFFRWLTGASAPKPAPTPDPLPTLRLAPWPENHEAMHDAELSAGWAAAVTPGSKPSRWANLVKAMFDSYGIEGSDPPAVHATPMSENMLRKSLIMWGEMTVDEQNWAIRLLKARGYDILRDKNGKTITPARGGRGGVARPG